MPNFQTIAALCIVAGAAFFLVRRIHKNLKKNSSPSCGCGCSACGESNDCEEFPHAREEGP